MLTAAITSVTDETLTGLIEDGNLDDDPKLKSLLKKILQEIEGKANNIAFWV